MTMNTINTTTNGGHPAARFFFLLGLWLFRHTRHAASYEMFGVLTLTLQSDTFLSPSHPIVLGDAGSSALTLLVWFWPTMEGYLKMVQHGLVAWAPFMMQTPKIA